MKAYELVGQVDSARHLHVRLPADAPLPQDDVRVLVLLPESQGETEAHWAQGVALSPN